MTRSMMRKTVIAAGGLLLVALAVAGVRGQATGDAAEAAPKDKIELHVKETDLSSVLKLLADQQRLNIVAGKDVTGKVTADLYGVSLDEALYAVLEMNGYGYRREGNFVYVYTKEEIAKMKAAEAKAAALAKSEAEARAKEEAEQKRLAEEKAKAEAEAKKLAAAAPAKPAPAVAPVKPAPATAPAKVVAAPAVPAAMPAAANNALVAALLVNAIKTSEQIAAQQGKPFDADAETRRILDMWSKINAEVSK